jgi:D-alanyl-D-alanine carboxypeptidase (penicillin-binding protein 5/6)
VSIGVVIVIGIGLAEAWHVTRPLPVPASQSSLASVKVPGGPPVLPWPSKGQGAVQVPALGFAANSGETTPVPVASLTKLATAVVILRDHPVPANASGPSITLTASDVAEYDKDAHSDESVIAVAVGEVLTERQLLEGLLARSANNIAFTLAVWDAGSEAAFVVKMNALAASLGMTSSHYVDASGFDQHSVSSAVDCLKVAAAAMAIPTFAEVAAKSSVTLPLVGTLPNLVTEIGSNGVVGIKSGYTSEAGGCMVLAAERVIAGRPVLVLAVVIGQPVPAPIVPPTTTTTTTTPPPATTPPTTTPVQDLIVPDPERFTRPAAESLLSAAEGAVVPVLLSYPGKVVGTATSTWGGMPHEVAVATSGPAMVLAWPGQTVVATHTLSVPPGGRSGARVGTVSYALGTQLELVPLRLSKTLPEPSWWWRLIHR